MSDEGALQTEFHEAMLQRYEVEIRDAIGKPMTSTVRMIREHGGLETVRILMQRYPTHESEGYATLFMAGKLALTLEALMLEPRFQPLFTEEELAWARAVFQGN